MEPMQRNLLIVDDDADVLLAARMLLKRHFAQVDIEKNPERIPFRLGQTHYDAILLDMNFEHETNSGREGFHWLNRILDLNPAARIILITAYGDVEMAVRALKAGATDFVLKPWQNDKLLTTILGALPEAGKTESAGLPSGSPMSSGLLLSGESPAMQAVLDTIARVAPTDANVLIMGENGTGKDLVARELHRQSLRHDKPLVVADLGSLPDTLFESELFGHVKGAFTDARADRVGRFEEAHEGTIFLDEIGNIGLPQQARLLTVLQQRAVVRVGSNQARPVNVRLISATNVSLTERVSQQRFRQDLLYRLNTIEISLPPLRDRRADIPLLAQLFLKKYRKQYNRPIRGLSPAAVRQLQQYRWPGNVRELQHAIERAVILAAGPDLEPGDFVLAAQPDAIADSPVLQTVQLEEAERRLIQRAMQQHQGNISEVARELGLSRQALYRRLSKHGL